MSLKIKGHPYDPKSFKLDLTNVVEGTVVDKFKLPFRITTKIPVPGTISEHQVSMEMIVIDFYLIIDTEDILYYIPCNFVTEILSISNFYTPQ